MSTRSALTRSRVRYAWQFLLPMLIVLALVAGWPLARTIWFGFTDANLSDLSRTKFIGLDNYLAVYDGEWSGIIADPWWWRAVGNTMVFTVVSVALETIFGFAVALVLNAEFPGRSIVRAVVLIPWAIPTIVSARMWAWMLHDQFGIVNDMLMHIGVIHAPVAWTASGDTAMAAVVMVDVWKTTPFMALLILAGLQMLPGDIYEAARLDGIHPAKVFWRVTLPLVWPTVMVAIVFRALDAMRIFDLIYVLTSNSRETASMSVYARQQLVDFQEVGLGSAASTLLFFVVAIVTILTLKLGRVRFSDEVPT